MKGDLKMAKKIKAIVIGVNLKNQENDFEYLMEELKGLATACKIEVVAELSQNLNYINNSHYIGNGKIRELGELLDLTAAELVIANDELSPSQIRLLEDRLDVRVVDRTMLILDIFAQRAKTREAKLQVEVARLQYMLPRLVGQRKYDRQGGGAGLINRGAGETSLELSRRRIEDKIVGLEKELEVLASQRKIQRNRRKKSGIPVVSLVGYTNAGKSTLLNAMVEMYNSSLDKQVFEKDMLFATLETSVRKINLPDNKLFLLTDTVGFVNRLPHHLVKAFRSTLEEVVEADLIIHVVDYSDPKYQKSVDITNKTLEEIGVENTPIIYAFNKGDLTDTIIPHLGEDRVYLSAKKRTGINELIQLISEYIFKDYTQCEMLIPYGQEQLVSYFHENANVLATSYEEEGTKLNLECKESDYEKYQPYVISNKIFT